MSKLTPYLTLHNADKAVELYKEVFKAEQIGEIEYLSSFEGFEEYEGKIAHIALEIKDTIIFINDNIKDDPLDVGDHIQLVLELDELDELHNIFSILKEEGHVFVEPSEVPWATLSCTVRDKFHVTWMLFVN